MIYPASFQWGASTAAYQIEGAVDEDGRGPSIWDTFSRSPGRIWDGDTGDVATDHYHRYAEDVALMSELGLDAYRFSIAWPRVFPDGRGEVNSAGLDFYRRLTDLLCENGIQPVATLYHWDLPQALQDEGGWARRGIADDFARYAEVVAGALDGRVARWITLNEPWCSAFLGYGSGIHAPGLQDKQAAVDAAHHLLLAHGRAVPILREIAGDAEVGVTLNLYPVTAASTREPDMEAARVIDGQQNRFFLDALFHGAYPDDVLDHLSATCDVAALRDGDLAEISAPLDFLGVNYYTRHTVRAAAYSPTSAASPWVGAEHIEFVDTPGDATEMGWVVAPDGLTEILVWLDRRHPGLPIVITENGAAYPDEVSSNGSVHDVQRTEFLQGHVSAIEIALEKGVDVRGYFLWSLLDNFEWGFGYAKRFGIVYVDYATGARIPKDSAWWYRDHIARSRSGDE